MVYDNKRALATNGRMDRTINISYDLDTNDKNT